MTWNDLLNMYEDRLEYIRRRKKYNNDSFTDGMYFMLRTLIREFKFGLKDFPKITNALAEPDKEEKVFNYRGHIFPVLVDDYGQQLYIEYKDQTISGGAFNSSPELNFSEQLDDILDQEFFSGIEH